ncbi:MAG TPA: hypothetical protein VF190_02615 [Rhodothermales bacterium]
MIRTSIAICAAAAFIAAPALAQHEHEHGMVSFETSCDASTQDNFLDGVALLHHMMYEQAAARFDAVAKADPTCAMAHWGLAMTNLHPLWAPPTPAEIEAGRAEAAKAREMGAPTDRETAFIAAIDAFFAPQDATFPQRLAAWEAGMKQVQEIAPDDVEANAFYALSQLATAPRDDRTFAKNAEVGARLQVLHRANPDHPGLFHYIIHAYDNPVLAAQAEEVARGYDKLAPNVPHALHMPSHIFVRLGMWGDVIAWNRRSANAALEQPAAGGLITHHFAHALDYLVYANLQIGNDAAAQAALDEMLGVQGPIQPTLSSAYGMAAARARVLLERGDWDGAVALTSRIPENFPWQDFPAAEAILEFARGIGAARTGDVAVAAAAAENLDALHARLLEQNEAYWATIVDAQRKSVRAWQAYAEQKTDEALAMMKEAADLEDSVDKHPVTPSAVRPARELYGEMLVMAGRPQEAIGAFDATLAISPGRLNALYGAGSAAEKMNDHVLAMSYYQRLGAMLTDNPGREDLVRVRGMLAGGD